MVPDVVVEGATLMSYPEMVGRCETAKRTDRHELPGFYDCLQKNPLP
jgi:hypothetical protein